MVVNLWRRNPVITHVDLQDPAIGYDEDGTEYQLHEPVGEDAFCWDCGKIFDSADEQVGYCVECVHDVA
jgi:hypothetical protein